VLPLRSFSLGKARLTGVLDDDDRIALARSMAERVVLAAGGEPLVVVSSAPEVAGWAAAHDLERVDDPGSLDGAATVGREWVRERGLARVVVVHGDLPLASTLSGVAEGGRAPTMVIVPDRTEDGTPVLSLPVDAEFVFAYGPGSYHRHLAEAARCGLEVRVDLTPELRFDVDVAADVEELTARRGGTSP
jgi:2-phospho-L-lactate guanylyltransferase